LQPACTMKTATLLHNPAAGNETHSKKKLVSLVERNGYKCRYLSTKKNDWKNFADEKNLIIVAGGDGTIRKTIKELLTKKELKKSAPIAILPLGTANNIIKALKITGTVEEIIASWKNAKLKKYDLGIINGISETDFFLEAAGFGLFPYLLKNLEKDKSDSKNSDEEKKEALHALHKCIYKYKPVSCKLKIDGKDYSGKYLMIEVMNTNSLGPNLNLSPTAEIADGWLDIVLINEKNQEQFASYILRKVKRDTESFPVIPLKAKKVSIDWNDIHVHADDQLIKLHASEKIKIKVKKKKLKFLI
jgi:diacylglycerol kinase (ATP)